MLDGTHAVFVSRDRYEIPWPRPAVARVIDFPENVARNAYLLATQVRVSGGATESGNMMGENGRMTWKRVVAVLNPQWCRKSSSATHKPLQVLVPLAERVPCNEARCEGPRDERDAKLLAKLRAVAIAGDDLPWLADLAVHTGHSMQVIVRALGRLETRGDIVAELSPHRPGLRRQARITVHGYGIAKTPGWTGE